MKWDCPREPLRSLSTLVLQLYLTDLNFLTFCFSLWLEIHYPLDSFLVRELWSQRQPWEGFFKWLLALFPHLPETDSAATRSELGWLAVAPGTISWKLDVNLDYAHGVNMCVPAGVDIYSRSIFRKLDFSLKNKKPSLLVTLPDSTEK